MGKNLNMKQKGDAFIYSGSILEPLENWTLGYLEIGMH